MKIIKVLISNDFTKKYYFQSSCCSQIEACLLYLRRYGYIVCVSSQIGCSQKCKFCAAGEKKFIRNLSSQEIQDQVRLIVNDNQELLTKQFEVTYMGSGEPLSNFINVFDSIDNLRAKYTNLTRINISTTFPELGKSRLRNIRWDKYKDFLHFQYSLHFTTDFEREKYLCSQLLKINDAISELNYISNVINDTYKINYIPFNNLNDNLSDVEQLADIMCETNSATLKISEMCDVNNSSFLPSKSYERFVSLLSTKVRKLEIFKSNGTDVNAGCGQFYNESII